MLESVQKTVAPFTRAIIKFESENVLKIIGSSFLYKKGEHTYLITASHVLKHHSDTTPLFVGNEEGNPILIDGLALNSQPTSDNKDDIDVSIINLSKRSSIKLRNTPAIQNKHLYVANEKNHQMGFLAIGFPLKKNNRNIRSPQFMPQQYCIHVSEASEQKYKTLKLNKDQHLALNHDERRVFSEEGQKRNAYNIRGFSGCPVWAISESQNCTVVSVLTEHHQKYYQSIVTSKIGEIINKFIY